MTRQAAWFRSVCVAVALTTAALAPHTSSAAPPDGPVVKSLVTHGSWVDVGPLASRRASADLIRLPSGRVLILGGGNAGDCCCVRRVDLYRPSTDRWVPRAAMPRARCSPIVRLAGGRVLVAGGERLNLTSLNLVPIRTAEIYDPRQDRWTPTTPMHHRGAIAGVRLRNGTVLMVSALGHPTWAEIYHPRSARWTDVAAPAGHHQQLVRLRHGGVLAFGWTYRRSDVCFERYSVRNDMWHVAGNYPWPCPDTPTPSWVMPDGRVMIQTGLRQVHVYDPATNRWRALPPIPLPRQRRQLQVHAFVNVDGQPMAIASKAGCSPAGGTTVGYRWQPRERRWRTWTALSDGALGLAIATLRDGSVLIAGGVRWFRSCAIGGDHYPSSLAYRYYPDR